jgi:outer membrane protein assembly factor BamB
MLYVRGHFMSKGRRKNHVLTVLVAFAIIFSVLASVLGAVADESVFRYDEKRTGNSQLISNIVDPEIRWTHTFNAPSGTVAIAGDINGDGKVEIVRGTSLGELVALDENGNEIWTFHAAGRLSSVPSIADVDGDGKNEVLIGGSYFRGVGDANLYAVNGEDGSLLWAFSTLSEGYTYMAGFENAPSFYDINSDGKLDVLIGSRDYNFYAINGADGTLMWKSRFEHFIRASSPVGDIDKDGKDEILVGDNHALMRLFEMDGTLDWEIYAGYSLVATPIFADVDGDSYDEIILFTVGRANRGIPGAPMVYNYDGSLLWTNTEYTFFYSTPTIYDVDKDGLPDIINVDSDDQVLIAYKGTDGSILWTAEPFEPNFMGTGITTADIDGDGEIELLVAANPNLYCINAADGNVEWIYDSDGERVSGSYVVDLDQDGLAEILIRINENLICLENAPGPLDLLDKIIEYILGLDDDCFKNNADSRKNTLVNKLEEIRKMINDGDYDAAISKLQNDIRPKMDGEGKNDWITCENAQDDLTGMIDQLIEMLESL